MNEQNFEQNSGQDEITPSVIKSKKKLIIIIGAGIGLLLIIAVITAALGSELFEGDNSKPYPPLDPSLLADTKDEDFDIFEYKEYLQYNRVVMLTDKNTGVTESIDDETYKNHGEAVALIYEMLQAIIRGDSEEYNSMVLSSEGHYESFTQQQLYDMRITREGQTTMQGKNGTYTEYVFTLEYKIHENNGTFKNNLLPDYARPHKIVINDSTGELLVMDIIEPQYKEK